MTGSVQGKVQVKNSTYWKDFYAEKARVKESIRLSKKNKKK